MLTIRSARLNRGMSLTELAQAVGVSVASVRQAEQRDEAGTITIANRARYLSAMGLADAIVTVEGTPEQVESEWEATMENVASINESMAFEGQPVPAVPTERSAMRAFASAYAY